MPFRFCRLCQGGRGLSRWPRGPKPQLAAHYDRLRNYNAEHPDHHPAEAARRLGLAVSAVTVWRAFVALGLTFKKNPSTLRNANAPT